MIKKGKSQNRLIYFAKKHLNKPYKYGAKLREAPRIFDCSTFIQYLYKRINVKLPRTALAQAHYGKKVNLKNLQPGDLIFLHRQWGHYNPEFSQGIGHVAMYIGNNKVIHASPQQSFKWKIIKGKVKGRVTEQSLKGYLKREKLIVIKRIL